MFPSHRCVLSWSIQKLEKNTSLILPQGITVVTRDATHSFSMFSNFDEVYKLTVQLANLAMKQYVLAILTLFWIS